MILASSANDGPEQHATSARQQGNHAEARQLFEQALAAKPSDAELRLQLAAECLSCNDASAALAHADLAQPEASRSWLQALVRGLALQRLDRCDEASRSLAESTQHPQVPGPARLEALKTLADLCLNTFGDPQSAAVLHRQISAGQSTPETELTQILCDLYVGTQDALTLSRRMKEVAGRLVPQPPPKPVRKQRPSSRPLRIGLISNQWCASPVAFLTLGALREMARSAELVFFDRGGKADWAHTEMRTLAREWHPMQGLGSEALAAHMASASLDALIDLSGWTDIAALCAVATSPAPRVLKWVGGQSMTTGLACFDGFITDSRQVPSRCEPLYSEPMLHATHGYVTYTAPPYDQALGQAASQLPTLGTPPSNGHYAVVSNPAKLSAHTAELLRSLKPRRLILLDRRWKHEQTRAAARQRLGSLMDVAEFITPANHPDYLDTLRQLDAPIVDTAPYSMGLTAIELRLLGKAVIQAPRSLHATMRELHCQAHLQAQRFDHHGELATQLLHWCSGVAS